MAIPAGVRLIYRDLAFEGRSISSTLAVDVGSAGLRHVQARGAAERPSAPNGSVTGQGLPKLSGVE